MDNDVLFNRFLEVIEEDIVPLTDRAITIGSKIYGAAVLHKKDLSLVVAGTNQEAFSPLWHGELYTIKLFFELQGHPDPSECLFLATHEPCPMCTAAFAATGFQNIYYLFDYDRTGTNLSALTGLKVFREIFNCEAAMKENSFFTIHSLINMAQTLKNPEKGMAMIEKIKQLYRSMTAVYKARTND